MEIEAQEVPPAQEEEFLPSAVTEHHKRLSRESPSLEIFPKCMDSVLCPVLGMSLFKQRGGSRALPTGATLGFCDPSVPTEVPSPTFQPAPPNTCPILLILQRSSTFSIPLTDPTSLHSAHGGVQTFIPEHLHPAYPCSSSSSLLSWARSGWAGLQARQV